MKLLEAIVIVTKTIKIILQEKIKLNFSLCIFANTQIEIQLNLFLIFSSQKSYFAVLELQL